MTSWVRSNFARSPGSRRLRSAVLFCFTLAGILMGRGWALEHWVPVVCEPAAGCLGRTLRDSLFPVALRMATSAMIGLLIGMVVWSLLSSVRLDRSG